MTYCRFQFVPWARAGLALSLESSYLGSVETASNRFFLHHVANIHLQTEIMDVK